MGPQRPHWPAPGTPRSSSAITTSPGRSRAVTTDITAPAPADTCGQRYRSYVASIVRRRFGVLARTNAFVRTGLAIEHVAELGRSGNPSHPRTQEAV